MSNNQSHTDRFEELCAGYVLNALNPDEQREFEKMLDNASPEQLETFHQMRSTANQLAFTVEPAKPSAEVKEQLMEKIQHEGKDDSSGTQVTPVTAPDEDKSTGYSYSRKSLAIAASIALLLISLALLVFVFNQNSTINSQEARITELETELEQKKEMLAILEARTVDLVAMNGLEVNPNGYGKIIWDAERQQALLQVSNLPEVPEGKAYQLWLIKNNKPVPSATFSIRNTGGEGAFFKIEQMAEANQENTNAFAITLEPEGGSQTPTGDTYLLGNVSQPNN